MHNSKPVIFIFSILEGGMGKCHVEAKTLEKQNSMLSFLIYMYKKQYLKNI